VCVKGGGVEVKPAVLAISTVIVTSSTASVCCKEELEQLILPTFFWLLGRRSSRGSLYFSFVPCGMESDAETFLVPKIENTRAFSEVWRGRRL